MPGLIALAVAMGIGRFAFTPLLPMMQADAGLDVARGSALAAANYAGYLAGALLALQPGRGPGATIRAGLALVAATTAAMAATHSFPAELLLRSAAGVASAWVLVFVSAWGFERPALVFTGVGAGIAVTGLACLAFVALRLSSDAAWLALGLLSLVATIAVWKSFGTRTAIVDDTRAPPFEWTAEARRLVVCYGAFGFGYIVPATFLPALARQAVDDPLVYGWSWPLFGMAAAASTLLAGRLRRVHSDRTLWVASHVAMAAGVALAMPFDGFPAALRAAFAALSALLVGGTFMVITMAGVQEARRVTLSGARTLIAAMTAAFALGQIAGPLAVSAAGGFAIPLALAAALLLATAALLRRTP